jgi:hypothetical protein
MSALELDYSDPLSAELSDKRIINRLYELQGLINGIGRVTEIVEEIGRTREQLMADKMQSYEPLRPPGAPERKGDFTYEVLRAIQQRFGLFDPNNPTNMTDRFDPSGDLRLALTEVLQVQIGSGENFTPAPSGSKGGPLASATPVFEDPSAQRGRGLSSQEAVVKEIDRVKDRVQEEKDEATDPTTLTKNGLLKR